MADTITYRCPGGGIGRGYLAEAQGARAGVVVWQEWWGLNDQIRGVAARVADAGFTALAPDRYDGRVTGDADEANPLMQGLDWVGATNEEVEGAVRRLKESLPGVAVIGFCMGGALTVIAFEEALGGASVPVEIQRYDAVATALSWERAPSFLRTHL